MFFKQHIGVDGIVIWGPKLSLLVTEIGLSGLNALASMLCPARARRELRNTSVLQWTLTFAQTLVNESWIILKYHHSTGAALQLSQF